MASKAAQPRGCGPPRKIRGVIKPSTRLVLTNAIYFNAAWDSPFDPEDTDEGAFFAPDGEVAVPLMRQTARLRYAEGDGYQAVELPYDEQAIRFIALLPADGRFDEIERALDRRFGHGRGHEMRGSLRRRPEVACRFVAYKSANPPIRVPSG